MPSGSTCREIAERIRSGSRLTRDEARILWEFATLDELAGLANIVRFRHNPERIATYLVDRNINYTNVCNTDCTFCAFYRHDPKHPESYVLPRETIAQKVTEALELGATRILLQGGHHDGLPYSFYVEMISWLHENFSIQLNAFSPSEIQQMKKVSGKSYWEILSELKSAGMHGLPGGGAEILDDEVRRRVSPKKISADEWIEVMEVAHSLDLVTTSSMVIGFDETIEQRLNHFERVRNAQDRSRSKGHHGFNGFISWTLQHNEKTSIGRSKRASEFGASPVEWLRNAALARIFLDNIPHHQASWPTLGPSVAQIGLHYGMDDIGSTMMEENVVSQAGAPSKDRWSMSPEELRECIRGAGFTPAERNSDFAIVRRFDEESRLPIVQSDSVQ
jgi:cyclic dehypoxanthinyl futalosine synthase